MTDTMSVANEGLEPDQERHPKHRRDDVPVDGVEDLDLSDFGENPDTEVAG
jgi:hypothetical protein